MNTNEVRSKFLEFFGGTRLGAYKRIKTVVVLVMEEGVKR